MLSRISRTRLVLFVLLAVSAFALPAAADNVTISGTVNFSALDGSSLDHDHAVNGVFTVDDGDLTVSGTVNCNDGGPGNNNACAMAFAVSGNFTMTAGSALYAENRLGGGNGGNITITAGHVLLQGASPTQSGALISSATTSGNGNAGNITINTSTTARLEAGSTVSGSAVGGVAGNVNVSASKIEAAGLIVSGPSAALTGGTANQKGGNISLVASGSTEPAVSVSDTAQIISLGNDPGAGVVKLEGCGVDVRGAVSSLSKKSDGNVVVLRSGTTITIDSRDLGHTGSRKGALSVGTSQDNGAANAIRLYARDAVQIFGADGSAYSLSNASSGDAGSITILSLAGTVTANGNAAKAGDASAGKGGSITIASRNNVSLDGAVLRANGGSGNKGGAISVRSHSGGVSWQLGTGDVRPVGSSVSAANQGSISLTYCTTVSTSGTTFPTNGAPVGTFPTTTQTCSPAAPSLPAGEGSLPDCNDPPVAVNDAYTVAEGGTLNVPAPGVLANDSDPEGQPITAILVSGPAHGMLTLNANGSFTYIHDGSETTSDSFTYKANDGSLDSNVATVTITVTPVNDAPFAQNDSYTVAEGGTLNVAAPGVLSNDTDPDSPTLTAVLVSGPAHGSLALNLNGSFTYIHDGSETTSDSFTYKASDGTAFSNVATVSITVTPVNDPPVAVNDNYSVNEGATLNVAAPGVLGNDTDPDSPSLTAVLVSGPAHGSLTLNANGSFTYIHDGSETTSDSFSYKANDGAADSNVATVFLTINPVNDAPVANNDSYTVAEGGTLNVSAPGVLGNDTDVDSPSLTAVLVSGPAHGALTFNGDGSFTYIHDGSETTSDSFTYKANDGAADSNVATVSITITPVNDPPVANNDSYTVAEGGTLTISAPGVLGNDTDPDSPTLTASLVSGPAHGVLVLNADGSFSYSHDGSETSADSFTYKASDGTAFSNVATVFITVTPVNDPPVANNDSYSFSVGSHTVAAPGVLGNDTDVDSPSLTAILVSGPTAGTLALNPNGGFTFSYTGPPTTIFFTYKANDGAADSNVATVTINIINSPPNANPDSFSAVGNTELRVGTGGALYPAAVVSSSVLANDNDPDGNPIAVTGLATSPAHGTVTINPDGSFNYLPATGYVGSDSFQYNVSDGVATSTGTVTITIGTRIWYVRNDALLGGDGRSPSPFTTLAAAAAATPAGDIIYVHRGDGTSSGQNSGITLLANQQLIGEGVALVVSPYTLNPAGAKPVIGNAGGNGVTLGNGSVVRGVSVQAAGIGIVSNAKTAGTIGTVSVSGGTDGISISSGGGTFTLTDVSLTPGANGLVINSGTPTVNASNLDVTTNGFPALFGNAGQLNITAGADGSTVSTTGAIAVDLSTMSLGVSLLSLNATGGANGLKLTTTTGSFSVTGSGAAGTGGTITGSTDRGVLVTDGGSVSLNWMSINNAAIQGVLVSSTTAAASSLTVTNSSFAGHFSNAIQTLNSGTGTMTVTVDASSFTTSNAAVVLQATNGSLAATITNNTSTFMGFGAFVVTKSGPSSVTATITGNTIGTSGVTGSGCSSACNGISLNSGGSGTYTALVQNNIVQQVAANGIRVLANNGSSATNVTITGNTFREPSGAFNAIAVQSGSLSADTNAVCANIFGNTISGAWDPTATIFVRNTSAGSTFSVPGYAGSSTDTLAVAAFISGNNGGVPTFAQRKTTTPQNGFSGGPACVTPGP